MVRPVDVVLISYVSEEPNLALWHEHSHAQCMNWSVPISLIIEPSSLIEPVKVFLICFITEPVKAADLEVREKLTVVVIAAVMRVHQPVEVSFWVNELWMCIDEGTRARP